MLDRLHFFMLILIITNCNTLSFNQFKKRMENFAVDISQSMEEHYSNWCINGVGYCESLISNACIGVSPQKCDSSFAKQSSCLFSGAMSSNSSLIKFPPGLDYKNLDEESIRFICSAAMLENKLHEIIAQESLIVSMYIGSNQGLFLQFPGFYHGDENDICDDYDPRLRPWYTIASSSAKNIIVLFDTSPSIQKNGKLQIAKKVVNNIIDTLSISDNLAIIGFQNQPYFIGQSSLTRLTDPLKQKLKGLIQNIKSSNGQTDYYPAFKLAIDKAKQVIVEGISGCAQSEIVFLLITDGNPTIKSNQASKLVQFIKKQVAEGNIIKREIVLFIYAIGDINMQFIKKLSCSFRGLIIYEEKKQARNYSRSQFLNSFKRFYNYLSVGLKLEKPVWTQPYFDYYGFGRLTTISMPIYYTDKATNIRKVFGVTGIDLMMTNFDKYGLSQKEILMQLIGQNPCQNNNMTDCQIELLRQDPFKCGLENCSSMIEKETRCPKIPETSQIYKKQILSKIKSPCCGIKNKDFIFSCMGGIFTVFTTILIRFNWKKIRYCLINENVKQQNKRQNTNNNDNNHENSKNIFLEKEDSQEKRGVVEFEEVEKEEVEKYQGKLNQHKHSESQGQLLQTIQIIFDKN